jgi:hypothetical protein
MHTDKSEKYCEYRKEPAYGLVTEHGGISGGAPMLFSSKEKIALCSLVLKHEREELENWLLQMKKRNFSI